MLDRTTTLFSHVKPNDTAFVRGGLRDFFLYRDLGIAEATHGKVIAHLVKANEPPDGGTGWHIHEADFQIVIMTKGWAKFMYEDQVTLVEAGDVVHQRPGIRHYLFDYSPDMEYLEIVSPADFKSIPVDPVCEIPPPTPWISLQSAFEGLGTVRGEMSHPEMPWNRLRRATGIAPLRG